MASLRRWLLSRQCQLTIQLSVSLVVTSLFTIWSPIHFRNACLVPVFAAVIVGSLAQDQHIGTRLQVSAWVLGPTWLASILAGSLMSLAKLASVGHPQHSMPAGYVAATAVLALLGLSLLVFLQAVTPPGPGRVMGIIAVLLYGIMVTISTLYPDIGSMWIGAILLVILGTVIAAVVCLLVGFLVMPSLASDEVWRLSSEALQGAGSVLSYHTSLLMVDEPGRPAIKDSKASPPDSAASKPSKGNGEPRGHPSAHRAKLHKQQQQQQHGVTGHPKQQQQHEWAFNRPRHAQPARSSIEIAAAGAAVVAASQDAFKPAVEAAATAFSWVDEADKRSISSAGSEHSSACSITSLVGSDAIADAAAEYSKRFQEEQQPTGAVAPSAQDSTLSEQLLQKASQEQQEGQARSLTGAETVDAWVSATAAVAAESFSRRSSLALPARVSEDGSATISLSGSLGLGPGVLHGNTPHRKSLEGAASLDFMEELDDKTFLEMMRVLSQSKGSVVKPPAAADSALKPLASRSSQPAAAAAAAAVGAGAGAGRKGMLHSKSAGSALSALSVDGSSTAPDDWARAVSPRGRQLFSFREQGSVPEHGTDAPAGAVGVATTAALAGAQSAQMHAVASTAGSVISSHASVLHPPHWLSQQEHKQQQPTRFAALPSVLPAHRQPQQPEGSFSRRQSFGSRAWSFLALSSWTSAAPIKASAARSQPSIAGGQQSQDRASSKAQGLFAEDSATTCAAPVIAALPQLQPRPTTSAQLQPLIGRAKAALASARLEPLWLRPKALQHFDADACLKLLDDIELLLVRLSTLEGVSEERSLMGLHLHQLAHYKGIADALALIFAQLTAFMMHVATAVAKQETCHHDAPWLPQWLGGKAQSRSSSARQRPQHQQASSAGAAAQSGAAAEAAGPRKTAQRPSPFAAAAVGEVGAGADADGASMGLSTLLSRMERQGSGMSSYLWERKTGWGQARQMLKREMDASLGSYWWSVRKASKQLPVKVPRSREVMILIFLWPICNGVLEACERIESSAQQVLRHNTAASRAGQHSAGAAGSRWPRLSAAWCALLSALPGKGAEAPAQRPLQKQPAKQVHAAAAAASGKQAAGAGHGRSRAARVQAGIGGIGFWLQRQGQWAVPLVQLVLVMPALQAVYQAVTQDVPATLRSPQRMKDLLASRMAQASLKLLWSTGSVLLTTILLMAYIPAVASSVPIFGYAAVVLCFQPRVEATVDQATRRVLGTILGACLGLATNSIPNIFYEPFLMLACLAAASVVLGVLARPQRRTAIVLALLTLCAVSLCGYEAACCSARGGMRPVDTFVARMASVCGACVYVALVSRLLLPWYTADYALEQLADALEQSALLYGRIYASQLERMRLAELVAGQIKQGGPEALQVHVDAAPSPAATTPAGAKEPAGPIQNSGDASGTAVPPQDQQLPPAIALAACEAAEAKLLVVLRQQVLSRLVAVQLSLAKESVSWRRGVLATPPLVLNVLGAMNAVKEALASQRLALAPFTKHGAASMTEQPGTAGAGAGSGMLHMMEHCYSMWALPLHPLWLEILRTVSELTAATAAHLRRQPRGSAARAAARAELTAKLERLEAQRLDLRHGWLDIRVRLHRAVHGGQPWSDAAAAGGDGSLWPTDSAHLFTFTYGASRCLNAFAAAAQAVANSLDD